MAAKTVGTHLKALESGGTISRRYEPLPGEFDPNGYAGRRIYLGAHVCQHPPEFSGASNYPDQDPGIIPREVRHSSDLSMAARLLYIEIHLCQGPDGMKASAEYFEAALGIHVSAIRLAMEELYRAGLIWRFEKGEILRYGTTSHMYRYLTLLAGKGDTNQIARGRYILEKFTYESKA